MPQPARRIVPVVLLIAGVIASPARVEATCPGARFAAHQLDGWFEACVDTTPVSAHTFLLSNPAAANSAALDFICEDNGTQTGQGIDCQPMSGTYGDERITVQFDWGGFGGVIGCPNPAGIAGAARIMIHTVAANGRSIVMSLGYSTDLEGYVVEGAHPAGGPTGWGPISCSDPARKFITVDQVGGADGQAVVDLTLTAPPVASDCDAGTLGELLGTCPEGPSAIPARTPGRVYTHLSNCAGYADLRTAAWTFGADSDAQGQVHLSFPPPPFGQCVLLGATYRMNGQEIPVIAGFVPIPADIICPDPDGDGWTDCEGDCDNNNEQVYPGRSEICDGIDNDCDDLSDEGLGPIACGVGACARVVPSCVLGVPQTCVPGPPSAEVCNGIDDDCNHVADDFGGAADGDGDGVAGACDNCPVATNPSQADADHDGPGNSCDNCLMIPNPGQEDADFDERGDVCDNCPTEFNRFQDDSDLDGRGDVCDNCMLVSNPDQGDVDHDAEGDVCDFNDGLILIQMSDEFFVEWQQEAGFDSYNLYRGSLAVLRETGAYTQDPITVPLAAKVCGLSNTYALDGVSLSPGQAVFFLVTGNGPGGESSLGTNSAGQTRPNANPCP